MSDDLSDRIEQERRRMAEALAMLDDVIARMERERQDVVPKLRVASGVAADMLVRGLKTLDDKLTETRLKRTELASRRERFERVRTISAELARIRAKRESTTDEATIAALRDRAATLTKELETLRSRKP